MKITAATPQSRPPIRLAGLLWLALAACSAAAGDPADSHPGLNLIPWPKEIELGQGVMDLTADSRVVTGDEGLSGLAAILAGDIGRLTGLQLPVAGGPARRGDIVLRINGAIRAGEPILVCRPPDLVRTTDGAHTLAIGEQAVVEGFDYRALAEGTVTLLQVIRQAAGRVTLPRLAIRDWPHADYCAMMVDTGRQDHPLGILRQMVVACHMYKVRYLHLHMTDDQGWTFPSTRYPRLGTANVCVGHAGPGGVAPGVPTLGELRELVAFADARGVTIVPELEMPGHSGAALRSLPEIFDAINPDTGQPVGLGCMNMASEAIYPALDTIIGEMCDVFKSSPYFHIGSDEVSMGRVPLAPGYKAFMDKHGLANDAELADHFIAAVNEIVKQHGRKTIKWEGLANSAARDMVVMTWDSNSNMASQLIARGQATITCPWNLGVPWEEWSMYVCNGSRLNKGDPVLGATLVAWEQSAEFQLNAVRNVASRQERTWGPDNSVTEAGFAARFQARDAAVGRLIGRPPKAGMEATLSASAGTADLLEPAFAFDGREATFHRSAAAPEAGDHLTVELPAPRLAHAVEVLTGSNGRGLMDGAQLQVSADGASFTTVATLAGGAATAVLTDSRLKAVRLHCGSPQAEPMIVREIKIQLMVELDGVVADTAKTVGEGNIGVLTGDTTFQWANPACPNPVINRGFTLTFSSGGGNASGYRGPISGAGTVEVFQGGADGGFRDSPMVLAGGEPNTMRGTWQVRCGRLTLAKEPGVDAVAGTIVVGGQGDNDCLYWTNDEQVDDAATVELLDSPRGGASLILNGCNEKFASLTMAPHTRVATDDAKAGGVLSVGSLSVAGKRLPEGVYSSAEPWLSGGGFVVVGDVRQVAAAGVIDDANRTIGEDNIAVLGAATTFGPATGSCRIPVRTGGFGLTFRSSGHRPTSYRGFITGNGGVTYEAATGQPGPRQPLELGGPAASSYTGPTVLTRGVLVLNKPAGVTAVPGDLRFGGAEPANAGDGVILAADGQLAPSATVTLDGRAQPCLLDLAGHRTGVARVLLSGRARIRTGDGGQLAARQIIVDGARLADGRYRAPQPWLEGAGSVTIDPRVDISGRYDNPTVQIGAGNTGNMTGDTEFWVGVGTCDIDLATNGHTITFDSGDGNPLCYLGTISGSGDVVLLMGPSHTGFKDAPLRLAGERPNTTSGSFIARKGRVQLEKPDGVDAISGDVIVGGQGFNDCLHWINSNQLRDSATITLLDAGNNGAASLSLNGCSETVASLVMAANTTVRTDNPAGQGGLLTVGSLTVDGAAKPAGTYTAASEKWIDGTGRVVVAPCL